MKKKLELLMGILLLFAAFLLARNGAALVQSTKAEKDVLRIVIDAGHGGIDPGKVGINNALEKDVNLEIALKLEKKLKEKGIDVVMTRTDDSGLYSESSTNKKVEDMQERCKLISEAEPVFTVSIHQNSYITEDIKGAQVFYYGQSEVGKELAETIQASLIELVDSNNRRTAKANESYYLLKKTTSPTVIVECGFLSNSEEAALLVTSEYQDTIVDAIYQGILNYLEANHFL
ncbi:MAG: N-acetylmuramoyl-L-alanine amidase [Roseburia sp.]